MEKILRTTDGIIEGATTAEAVYQLSKKYKVDMPLATNVYEVIYRGKPPKAALRELMTRKRKAE